MVFEIEIADEIVDGLAQHLKKAFGKPIIDEQTGEQRVPLRYPGGVDQWIREIFGDAIANTPMSTTNAVARAKRAEILARATELQELFRPTVRRAVAP